MNFNLIWTVIENLPMEMRDRFTEMREMDLQVASELIRNNISSSSFILKMSLSSTLS